jgi:hypothetical protein
MVKSLTGHDANWGAFVSFKSCSYARADWVAMVSERLSSWGLDNARRWSVFRDNGLPNEPERQGAAVCADP